MEQIIFHRKTTFFCFGKEEANKVGSSMDAVLSVVVRTKKHGLKGGRLYNVGWSGDEF